ncbi:phage tail protein [Rahnella sp. ChDrAdgB13]|uniref:phage tail protein n=1 Tax=Rahnella sp. ChDrAdgB13 TaxID=1850581 RepID=UPI001AD89A4A|nr:phage tail protein [Rahnella sp. ChDrAdgB13]
MSQLDDLTAFLTANLPPDAMQMFQSTMDDCEITRSGKALGLGQRRVGVFRYNGRLSWDNFPYRRYSPGVVYALVLAWIEDHANELHDELNLADPTVDPEFDDEDACILEIVVALADPIIITPTDNGAVPFRGKRWDVVNPEIWTATEVEVITQIAGES